MRFRLLALLLCLCAVLSWMPRVSAEPTEAQDITAATVVTGTGYDSYKFLYDGDVDIYKRSNGTATLLMKNARGIGSLYLLFDVCYGQYTITDNDTGNSITTGGKGFLHEFVDLTELGAPTSITISFSSGPVWLSEIFVFSSGKPPAFVQRWDLPLEGKTDLLLMAARGGDEQLFFAGLLPLYAVEKNCAVQVVFLTDHRNDDRSRVHEMLNSLWAVGVTAYPVFGEFDDFRIDNLEKTYKEYRARGTSQEELQAFVVEQLRRFKPQVVVGHDLAGENGHGIRMVCADLLVKALDMSNDPAVFPELGYEPWEVSKTYLHLYGENQIVMNYDQPMTSFDGMTAFEVTQKLGFPCCVSQKKDWSKWIIGKSEKITQASQIKSYSPCLFGLYRSTVGEDVAKNDFFENLLTYGEQERLEQERLEQERLEQERLEQERLEQERLEQERLEQERLEQERLEQERLEQERLEQERRLLAQKATEEAEERKLIMLLAILLAAMIILAGMIIYVLIKRRKKQE